MHWGPSVTVLLIFRRLSPHLLRVIQLWWVGGKGWGGGGLRDRMVHGQSERESRGRDEGEEVGPYCGIEELWSFNSGDFIRDWDGFTAPIISSQPPPHWSSLSGQKTGSESLSSLGGPLVPNPLQWPFHRSAVCSEGSTGAALATLCTCFH